MHVEAMVKLCGGLLCARSNSPAQCQHGERAPSECTVPVGIEMKLSRLSVSKLCRDTSKSLWWVFSKGRRERAALRKVRAEVSARLPRLEHP